VVETRLLCLFTLGLAMAGCTKKAGDPCKKGQLACADKTTGLFCEDEKFAPMPCGGPAGCAKNGANVSCDNSTAKEGDVCNEPDDAACSVEKNSALQCKSGKFVFVEACKGPNGCQYKNDKIYCDNDISDLGDPCIAEGDLACSADLKSLLQCEGGSFKAVNACRGPRACAVHEHPEQGKVSFDCDDSVAEVNDPCDQNGEEACTADKRMLLQCRNNHVAFEKNCHGPGGCSRDATNKVTCDARGK
jgi:hypothetical protein